MSPGSATSPAWPRSAVHEAPSPLGWIVQVLGPDGDLREQADGDPIGGASPSSIWRAGDLLRDRRNLKQAPPTGGALLLGFYDRATGARLEARLDGERLGDDAFRSPIP